MFSPDGTFISASAAPHCRIVCLTPCSPSLEGLGQANVDVPPGGNCLPLLERGRGHMTGFGEEDCDHLMGSASRYLEFHTFVCREHVLCHIWSCNSDAYEYVMFCFFSIDVLVFLT